MKGLVALLFLATTAYGGVEQPIAQHFQRELIIKNLQLLVDETAKKQENHFFFRRLGQEDWIFWREGRLLMLTTFEAAVGNQEIDAEGIWRLRIRHCRKPINLDSGVVPTPADLPAGTTYHVTRDFVSSIVYDCVLNGELVVVKKTPKQAPASTRPVRDPS